MRFSLLAAAFGSRSPVALVRMLPCPYLHPRMQAFSVVTAPSQWQLPYRRVRAAARPQKVIWKLNSAFPSMYTAQCACLLVERFPKSVQPPHRGLSIYGSSLLTNARTCRVAMVRTLTHQVGASARATVRAHVTVHCQRSGWRPCNGGIRTWSGCWKSSQVLTPRYLQTWDHFQ